MSQAKQEELAQAIAALQAENAELRKAISQLQSPQQAGPKTQALYLAFENRFRGPESTIKEGLSFYLTDLDSANIDKETDRILDLGCGRGEWLQVLQENGYARAAGVDGNPAMVATGLAKGLSIAQADLLDYLAQQPDNAYGALSCFHVVEHLPYETLITLLEECLRVLRPGGIALFETPNPRNLLVGTVTFHFDPTHKTPIPWEILCFTGQHVGLQLRKVHPFRNPHPDLLAEAENIPDTRPAYRLAFSSGLDYAVVFQKPGEA